MTTSLNNMNQLLDSQSRSWIKELTSIVLYISTKVLRSILVLEYASTVSAAYPNPKKNHTWTNLLSTQKDMQTKKNVHVILRYDYGDVQLNYKILYNTIAAFNNLNPLFEVWSPSSNVNISNFGERKLKPLNKRGISNIHLSKKTQLVSTDGWTFDKTSCNFYEILERREQKWGAFNCWFRSAWQDLKLTSPNFPRKKGPSLEYFPKAFSR